MNLNIDSHETILDRPYQLELLKKFSTSYPSPYDEPNLREKMNDCEKQRYVANMAYLAEHGLVESGLRRILDGTYRLSPPTITAKGMDFLADDGGLSAILGTVTIRIHGDTLKELVEAKIMSSDLTQPEKRKWIDALRELPAESTKHLTMKLLDLALERAPDALRVIGTGLFQYLRMAP